MTAKFKKTVKYKGQYYAAGSEILITPEEQEELRQKGAEIAGGGEGTPGNKAGSGAENEADEGAKNASEKKLPEMTVPELKALAKQEGVEGYSALTKEELLAVLKDVV